MCVHSSRRYAVSLSPCWEEGEEGEGEAMNVTRRVWASSMDCKVGHDVCFSGPPAGE